MHIIEYVMEYTKQHDREIMCNPLVFEDLFWNSETIYMNVARSPWYHLIEKYSYLRLECMNILSYNKFTYVGCIVAWIYEKYTLIFNKPRRKQFHKIIVDGLHDIDIHICFLCFVFSCQKRQTRILNNLR